MTVTLRNKYSNSYLSYFLMYNFYYLSWALFSALISVYLTDKGFKGTEVSLIVSASFLSSMITQPLIGHLCDKYDSKTMNIILFVFAALGGILFLLSHTFLTILISYSFVLLFINGTNPLMERVATASPYQYGKIRIWGTIGYATGTQVAGLIYDYISPEAIFITFILTMILTIIGLIGTKPEFEETEDKQEKTNTLQLFTNKKFLLYIIISGLFYGVTNVGNTYIPTMLTHDGLKASIASTFLSIVVVFEAPLVLFSYKFMDKLSNKTLLYIVYAMITLQYSVYAFNMPLALKIIATLLSKHTASMLFIMINLKVVNTLIDPHMQITALAFVQTFRNLTSIIFNNIGGNLLDHFGYSFMFSTCLGVILIGFVLVLLFKIKPGTDKKLFS